MSTCTLSCPSVVKLFYFVLILPTIIAVPIPSNVTLYDVFVQSLVADKCEMPIEIHLPFPTTSYPSTFDYLKVPLKECQMAEALSDSEESNLLCKEIFEVLKNITCSKYNTPLPKIKSTRLPNDVCNEFKDMKDILPKQNKYLAGKLVDGIICKLLCSSKFMTLCQTLLWSYDVQYQIKNAVKNEEHDKTQSTKPKNSLKEEVSEDEGNDGKTITNKDVGLSTEKILQEPVLDVNSSDKAQEPITEEQTQKEDKTKSFIELINTNHLESTSPNINSLVSPATSNQSNTVGMSTNLGNNHMNSKEVNLAEMQNLPETKITNSDVQDSTVQKSGLPVDTPLESNKNVGSTDIEVNKIVNENKQKVSNNLPTEDDAATMNKNLTAEITQHGKDASSGTLQDQDKNKANTLNNNNNEIIANPEIPATSDVLEEKELTNNVHLKGEENESNVPGKSSDSEITTADNKNKLTGKPKEMVSATPIKVTSEIESSTIQISPDINTNADQDEEQDEKDAEQYYNDTENNEGDYPKSEYENTLNEISKARKPEIKSSVVSEVANPNEFPSNYNPYISRNNIGRGNDEMQIIPSFPEQEDSHFFFYFLSIVLILMGGYLIFHNKQKIIALIVEGRHERRRRSHGAGYKKLETK